MLKAFVVVKQKFSISFSLHAIGSRENLKV